jgi:hypothetical protein
MTHLDTDPIRVNATPGPDQVATGIRYGLMALASVASALGFAEVAGKFNDLLVTAGPIAALVVFVWGQWSARYNSKAKAVMAAQLPDEIAKFK